jgi:protein SCO1
MNRKLLWCLVFSMAGCMPAQPSWGAKNEQGLGGPPQANVSLEESNRNYFTDLPVITHEGKELRFYTDLLKDKVLLVMFFYTTCPTIGPDMMQLFRLQKVLGEQLGADFYILSISVDPETDDLKAIQEFAKKFNPPKGWIFLTGKKENMEVILYKLGNTNPRPEMHINLFLLGNLRTGNWMKMEPRAPAIALAEGLRHLAADE